MKKRLKILKTQWQTTVHKIHVMRFILKACWALIKRGFKHDISKYSKNEAPFFAQAEELRNFTYGTQEYKDMLKRTLDEALKHHYSNNSHHPEFHPNGINDMEILDVVEMLCDWRAATLRNKNGNIQRSVEFNQERFEYDELTRRKYTNFYKEIKSW